MESNATLQETVDKGSKPKAHTDIQCPTWQRERNTTPYVNPCGGRVEYLHREPASRKRDEMGLKKSAP
jgi:hypothetical protein